MKLWVAAILLVGTGAAAYACGSDLDGQTPGQDIQHPVLRFFEDTYPGGEKLHCSWVDSGRADAPVSCWPVPK